MNKRRFLLWVLLLMVGVSLILSGCGFPNIAQTFTKISTNQTSTNGPTDHSTNGPATQTSTNGTTDQTATNGSEAQKTGGNSLTAKTTVVKLTAIPIPPIKGKTLSAGTIYIDQSAHTLYVADRTDNGIDVFNVSTPTAKYVKTIALGESPNGVVVANQVSKLFTGLDNSTVAVIDIDPYSSKFDTVIAKVNTGGKTRAGELAYDAKDNKVYVANTDDGFVTVIDAVSNRIIKKIGNLGPALEDLCYDSADGMMYMTSSAQSAIFEFDPTKDALVKKFDIGYNVKPNGLAINPTTGQGLLGNSNKNDQCTVLWDFKTDQVAETFDQVGAGDAVIYDAEADRFFFAASHFNVSGVMGIFSGSPAMFLTNVPTTPGSHSVAYDETNKIVYTQDQTIGAAQLLSFPLPQ